MKDEICEAYNNTCVRTVDTMEEVNAFICGKANELNYGFYRHWEIDGVVYFDCGPRTFTVKKVQVIREIFIDKPQEILYNNSIEREKIKKYFSPFDEGGRYYE